MLVVTLRQAQNCIGPLSTLRMTIDLIKATGSPLKHCQRVGKPFLFCCPVTGQNVQGYSESEESPNGEPPVRGRALSGLSNRPYRQSGNWEAVVGGDRRSPSSMTLLRPSI